MSCCADDVLAMSDDQHKLQCLLDIASKTGGMLRIQYGAAKTKIIVSGPDVDQRYYADTKPWVMDSQTVSVVEDNDHLGQIISGQRQLEKNIDNRLKKGRSSLYSLLGSGFTYKCNLSPTLQLHLFRTFICPVMLSGLSTFAIRPSNMEPLAIFQRKILKSIFKLSKYASTSAIHFWQPNCQLKGNCTEICFLSYIAFGQIHT